ncbi:TetR family transcriptional regulator [Catellatospora methionotrophica]|uniref:TetR family transcriptional regulator n=1 Tax=Catellatospora methionotrophica TaxID=121620 RepID=A0A8J3LJR7_9ACTN|nr:TetR family transcriptional regulator [Catellatospora methionotrophica]GIG13980.1 TetR family transcriptional regulator [Catellatospora methionotrophica]
MTGRVINRREQHKRHTRVALEDAALALFVRQGYEQTTAEDIAAEAGVSVRTFFRYYSSKQHVLFGDVAHERVDRLRSALAARPAEEPPLESVRVVLDETDVTDEGELAQIRSRLSLLSAQPSLLSTYLVISEELHALVSGFVAARCGLPAAHPYPLLVAGAARAAWDSALWSWAGGHSPDLAGVRRSAFAQLTVGIRPPG